MSSINTFIQVSKYTKYVVKRSTHNLSSSLNVGNISSTYIPNAVEKDKYDYWEKKSPEFQEIYDSQPFTMIMPPPNVTGTLHLGHALTITIQDVLIRWKKMCGHKTLWIPGLDHAGIATQVIVEKKLWNKQKRTRHDIGREQFKKEILKWKNEKSKIIHQQIKNLGAFPDWSREIFTMDTKQASAVTEAFIRLFNAGLIYRSDYIVNWSCFLQSAISDIEVEYLEIKGRTKLLVPNYEFPVEFGVLTKFAYKLWEDDGEILVCTTRPETIPADTALAVNPADVRYKKLRGKHAMHPFRQEPIPIICDDFVDPQFGTGVVKVTPAHDPVDFKVAKHHNLKVLQIMDEKGIMNADSGVLFHGKKRFDVRKDILKKLEDFNLLRDIEDHHMTLPICSRSKDVIEYLIKPQWFLQCSKMGQKASLYVKENNLKIDPPQFKKVWFSWLEDIRDWCISRQLWWGHRIPAFTCHINGITQNKIWVAANSSKGAREKASKIFGVKPEDIMAIQDEDVLDTWFSSALLPFSVFGWPENADYQRYYPITLMETGHDILFFWVARMVMLGIELTGSLPFQKILLHGIICDAHGRKMSKSLGNVVSPESIISGSSLENLIIQIENAHKAGVLSDSEKNLSISSQAKMFPSGIPECGADALRFTLCSHNIKSHFIQFDVNECLTNKFFCNKIWQAFNYVSMSSKKLHNFKTGCITVELDKMDMWILSRLSDMVDEVNSALSRTDMHVATRTLKRFFLNEFCDVYLECTKPGLRYSESQRANSHMITLIRCLDIGLRCIAPFMPFLAEELYKHLPTHLQIRKWTSISSAPYPKFCEWRNKDIEMEVQKALNAVFIIRRLKKLSYINTKSNSHVQIITNVSTYQKFCDVIKVLSNCHKVTVTEKLELTTPTVSDTVDNSAIIHLKLPTVFEQNLVVLKASLSKKIDKINSELEKLQKMTSNEEYKKKAPENVQFAHRQRISSLEEELHKLRHL